MPQATSNSADVDGSGDSEVVDGTRDSGVAVAGQPPGSADDLIDISTLEPTIAIDIRYATNDNFAKKAVYPVARCRLRRAVAAGVIRANRALAEHGLRLKLWDCYRPFSVQEAFWKLVPDARYVARPLRKDGALVKGSKHNRGAAIDVTLISTTGESVAMPTDYDDFSPRAHRDAKTWTARERRNSDILTSAMVAEGFDTIASEWWHFDGPRWREFPLSDEPL